jgi:neutral ceramidase
MSRSLGSDSADIPPARPDCWHRGVYPSNPADPACTSLDLERSDPDLSFLNWNSVVEGKIPMKRFFTVPMMFLALMISGRSAGAATFKAGAGEADIQISASMLPVEGYTEQHDPISTRVLLLDDGSLRLALLVVDTPSIQDSFIDSWKAIVTGVTGVKPENAMVIASHDTSAPHVSSGTGPGVGTGAPPPSAANMGGRPQASPAALANAKAYAQAVDTSVEQAATKALATLQPVQVGFGLGTSHINVYRDVLTPKGWGLGYDDAGYTDPSLALIRINSLDGKPLAWLMDYAVRPAVLEQSMDGKDGGKAISGDLIGPAEHYLESHSDAGGTAIFVMGAGVDQAPYLMANRFVLDKDGNSSRVDIHDAGFAVADLLGERLGSEAVRVSDGIKTSATPSTLRIVRQSVEVISQARTPPNGPAPAATTEPGEAVKIPFVLLQIGDIAVVGVAPELNANIGVKIKTESPFPHTIVMTMVDGSAKYLPDTINYDRKTPEALGSRFARGSAENAATQIIESLKQMRKDTSQ